MGNRILRAGRSPEANITNENEANNTNNVNNANNANNFNIDNIIDNNHNNNHNYNNNDRSIIDEIINGIDSNILEIVLDELTKNKLIDHIKQLNPKGLEIDDTFQEKIRNIKLENVGLIPMCIELYNKISRILPEYNPNSPNNRQGKYHYKKKIIYVQPQFDINQIKKQLEDQKAKNNEELELELDLGPIELPTVRFNNSKITTLEYIEGFNNPEAKKDMIGISKKMLLNLPNYHKTRIINTYNKLLLGRFDDKISFGRASYIYKLAKKGPTNDINSFRQIVTIPNAVNHFHRLLSLRINSYMDKNGYLDKTIQKGGISGIKHGVVEQVYKVKSVIKDANDNGKELAILFLDISNAFGNLNLNRLLYILKEYKIDSKITEYIDSYYKNFKFYVKTPSFTSELLDWNDGLVQGCPLSPVLFITALNYVLTYLDKKYKDEFGYKINDTTNILFTAFVDDVSIICKNVSAAEEIFNKLNYLLKCLGLSVNKSKCALMCINPHNKMQGNIGFDNINNVKVCKYLGEYISSDGLPIESFKLFIKDLGRKLYTLNKTKNSDNVQKLAFFAKCILPWVQRRLQTLYDLDKNSKLKVVLLIKTYLDKWGNKDSIRIFTFITELMINSTDSVINNTNFTNKSNESDTLLKDDIDIANHIYDGDIEITYEHIKNPENDNKINTKNNENNTS